MRFPSRGHSLLFWLATLLIYPLGSIQAGNLDTLRFDAAAIGALCEPLVGEKKLSLLH